MPSIQEILEQGRQRANAPPPPLSTPLAPSRVQVRDIIRRGAALASGDTTLAEQTARDGGRFIRQEAGELSRFWKIANEITRPQKASFAGVLEALRTDNPAVFFSVAKDEFLSGIGTGKFKRDVQGSDIYRAMKDPDDVLVGDRTFGEKSIGLALDFIVDPINIIPAKFLIAPLRFGKAGVALGFSALEGVPLAGRGAKWLKEAFVVPQYSAGTAEFATKEGTKLVDNIMSGHRDRLLKEGRGNGRDLGTLAREAGMTVDEMHNLITTRYKDITLTRAGEESLERTMERIYTEGGLEGFDSFIDSAGGRLFADEAPIRRAILNQKFDELEPALISQTNGRITDEIKDVIFELKQGSLDRFIFERKNRKILTGTANPVFESIEKDYMFLASEDWFKEWSSIGVFGDMSKYGFTYSPAHASDLHSQFQDIGAAAVNELYRKGELSIKTADGFIKPPPGHKQIFIEDPFLVDTVRTFNALKAVETSKVLDDLVRGYGLVLDEASAANFGLKNIKEAINITDDGRAVLTKVGSQILSDQGMVPLKGIRGFENTALPAEAAEIVQKVFAMQKDPDAASDLAKAYKFIINDVWKPWTLLVFPEFHFRNLVSNQFLKNIGNMNVRDIVSYEWKAGHVLAARQDPAITKRLMSSVDNLSFDIKKYLNGEKINVGDLKDIDRAEVIDLFQQLGVIRSGQFGASEVGGRSFAATASRSTAEGFSRLPAGVRGAAGITVEGSTILRAGANVGSAIEDMDRLAMAMWALDQGMDAATAAKYTNKHMIDYRDHTDFEKKVRDNFIPFYMWARKSMPILLESLVSQPAKWNAITKVKNSIEASIEQGDVPESRLLPEFIRKGMGINWRRDKDGNAEYLVLNNWLPHGQVTEVINDLSEIPGWTANQLNPAIKSSAEIIFQKYLFFDKDFSIGQKDFAGFRVTDSTLVLLRNIRALGIVDRFVKQNNPGAGPTIIRTLTGINSVNVDVTKAERIVNARKRKDLISLRFRINEAIDQERPDVAEELESEFLRIQENR